MSLAQDLLEGSRRALARALTVVENGSDGSDELLSDLFPHSGRAALIGVTGAPGTGKSSLVNQMALAYRREDKTVGIIAVDPTSPFSGGAILGDRIRMRDLSGDSGVFIRSMATRGSLGGLARATSDTAKVLDAAGMEVILIETVGAGQSEVDIARHAHTVIVVEAPGLGDDVQAIKAGILEIADILVVNKGDDPRAKGTVSALRAMLDLGSQRTTQSKFLHHGILVDTDVQSETPDGKAVGWDVPIQLTTATDGTGVLELLDFVAHHRQYLAESGEGAKRAQSQLADEVDHFLRDTLIEKFMQNVDRHALSEALEQVRTRQMTPRSAALHLVTEASREKGELAL